jgi:phosphate-selective porin OprO/OprP
VKHIAIALLGTSAWGALCAPAFADDAAIERRLDQMQRMIDAQQRQIEAQKSEIGALKRALGKRGVKVAQPVEAADSSAPAPLAARVDAQQKQIDLALEKLEAQENSTRIARQEATNVSIANGRPTITSSDGRFSASIRTLGQYDVAYYMQNKSALALAPANGPDLSSGANFRRAQLGVQGKVFGDWSYNFNYDFAGSGGTETPGHIQAAYVEYDGLAPFAFRIGAYPASNGLEDNTASADTIFLERNSPSDVARNIAGGDGRDGMGFIYASDRVYAALSYTGDKIQDSGVFDEQQALIGRLSGLVYSKDDTNIVLSGSGTWVFKVADSAAGPKSPRPITLSDPPELTVDNTGTKLVTSGSINATNVWQWGIESGAQWENLYGQAGYFAYGIDQRSAPGAFNFNGWYAQATWVITGESRTYNSATASFVNPKPRVPFSLAGKGWGAWEVAGRFSDMNFNDNPGVLGSPIPAGGDRGGDQRIWTFGLNWYPNSVIKFELQYQNVDVSRIGTIPAVAGPGGHPAIPNAEVGQNFDTIAFRSQISL